MQNEKRMYWPDLLRIIGAFFVILIHVTASGINNYPVGSPTWAWSLGFNALCNWAVPVFIMISGMFLLDPEKAFDTRKFYRKNVTRILIDALVFGLLYAAVDCVINGDFSLKAIALAVFYTLTGKAGYHLWYLFTLLVLYAATPVLRVFTAHATKKELDHALAFWIVLTVVCGQINGIARELAGLEELIPFSPVILTGLSGYYLLGYRLKKYPLGRRNLIIICVLAVLSAVIMPPATVLLSMKKEITQFGVVVERTSPGNFIIAAALFSLAGRLKIGEKAGNVIVKTGSFTFGIYLWHVLFVTLLFRVFKAGMETLTPLVQLGYAVLIFAVSLGLTALCKLIPGVKRLF